MDDRLKSYIERIEKLKDEAKAIQDDIRGVLLESKCAGYSPKIIREVIKIRAKNPSDRDYDDQMIETYLLALGEK